VVIVVTKQPLFLETLHEACGGKCRFARS